MKFPRLVVSLASSAAIVAASLLAVSPAQAAPTSSLPEALVNEVRSVWTEHGVAGSTQDQLISKMESGQSLDANLGVAPVSQSETDNGLTVKTVSTYADGSISVTDIQRPNAGASGGGISSRAVQGCTTTWSPSVIKYRNCSANGWFTGVALAFFVDYDAYASTTKIVKYHSGTVKCNAGLNCSTPQFEKIRLQGTNSAPAQVNLTTTWNSVIGGGTTRLNFFSRPGNHGYTN